MTPKPHVLYRMFDQNDTLLYVGLTNNPKGRFGNHRDTKEWWGQVRNITVENFTTRDDLIEAERKAIETEKPLHNVIYNRNLETTEQRREREEAELCAEEDREDRCMGIALNRMIAEEAYGITRNGKSNAATYMQYVAEARELLDQIDDSAPLLDEASA